MRTTQSMIIRFGKTLVGAAIMVLGIATVAQAQVPKDIEDFTSHGIRVILRNTSANQVVAACIGVEGGLAYGETENASIGQGTASLMAASGSKKYPKEKYRDELARLSTSIGGSGSFYSMEFTMKTTTQSWNTAWDIFSDVVMHPAFDTVEAQRQQQNSINAIESRSSDPESYTDFVIDSLWKLGSRLNHVATVEEVQGMQLSDLAAYHDKLLQRARMVLVVVGKVSRADIEKKLAGFEAIPMGSPAPKNIDHIAVPTSSHATLMTRDIPTTYVAARFASASLATPDWWGERIMYEILDKRLFDEVRTKRNLSYSPGAYPLGTHGNWFGTMTLQSVLPDSATRVALGEIRKLQTTPVGAQELADNKAGRITTAYYRMQTNLDQARNLYTNLIETGDWRNLFYIVPETEKVTAADVQRAATKYMHNFQFVTLGPDGKATMSTYSFE